MRTAACRRCGQPVPPGAARCPRCLLKNPAPTTLSRLAWILGLVLFLIVLLVLLFGRR